MSKNSFPITQVHISNKLGRSIKSPIYVSDLKTLGIHPKLFLEKLSPFFSELPWDSHGARRLRLEFLKNKFPNDVDEIHTRYSDYYLGKIQLDHFDKWINQLNQNDIEIFQKIQPWRRCSVAQFSLNNLKHRFFITREPIPQLDEKLEKSDFQSLPDFFEEAPEHHVENHFFISFLVRMYKKVLELQPKCKVIVTVYFMSVQATDSFLDDNFLNEVHKKENEFFVSSLVVNRTNVKGGESQILEKMKDGTKEIIFKNTLQPSEFIFHANHIEELKFGNDLQHHVTPINIDDKSKGEGWRDIIRFDFSMVVEDL